MPTIDSQLPSDRALLVGVYRQKSEVQACHDHLDELERLADTYGLVTADKVEAPLRKVDVATFLGSGKIEELKERADKVEANLIIFDENISPAQQRNLEKLFDRTVMDRTELILGVFHDHARSKEARLQVELAEARYEAPRLKRLWTHLSRQRGGGTFQKGEGEKQIEIDRRLLGERVAKIERNLAEVRRHRETQRNLRERTGVPTFAIVGYTNAGKSTLLNALTDAGILAEDKLFATLDTTTRKFALPNRQEVLLIDTVGFIRKLPHELVAAFKSTLEEAVFADILIHLVDASHPNAIEQAEAACEVLEEIGATDRPVITVLNKIDQCGDSTTPQKLRILYPHTVQVSALERSGFEDLMTMMEGELEAMRRRVELVIPQSNYALVSEVMEKGQIIEQDYEDNDVRLTAMIPVEMLPKVEGFRAN